MSPRMVLRFLWRQIIGEKARFSVRGLTNNELFSPVLSGRAHFCGVEWSGGSCRLVCVYGCRMVALELSGCSSLPPNL